MVHRQHLTKQTVDSIHILLLRASYVHIVLLPFTTFSLTNLLNIARTFNEHKINKM